MWIRGRLHHELVELPPFALSKRGDNVTLRLGLLRRTVPALGDDVTITLELFPDGRYRAQVGPYVLTLTCVSDLECSPELAAAEATVRIATRPGWEFVEAELVAE
jgi:hypothetical protein